MGGAHLESLRFHFNLTLASLKTLANHSENRGTGANGTGGPTAPREPTRSPKSFENKRNPTSTHQHPSRKHQGCSIVSQNNFLFDFAKQSQAPSPKGTDPTRRTGALMTIKSPATGSRTQEPLRFPGLSKPPTSDLTN